MTDTSGDGTWTPPAGARVCVIGAGVAGLVTAKVLRHDGFEVTVFEKEPTIGGVWAASRTYPGLRTNNPRETYAYSDFPYPETADDFPTAEQVREYLGAYADHFELRPHLRLSTEVVSVSRQNISPRSGPGATGVWRTNESAVARERHVPVGQRLDMARSGSKAAGPRFPDMVNASETRFSAKTQLAHRPPEPIFRTIPSNPHPFAG